MNRVIVLVVALLATGCSVPIARLTAAAPARAPVGLDVNHGRHAGRSCRWWVLGVPLGLPRIEDAMTMALARGRGRLLRDVVITSDHPVYLLFGRNCYTVTGDVIA
jgi:hypothetical protein